MSTPVPETIVANGRDLSTLVSNISSLTKMLSPPPRRPTSTVMPFQHGRTVAPVKWHDAATVALPMWVLGCEAISGATPGDAAQVTAYYANADALVRLFHEDPLVLEHHLPNGDVRVAVTHIEDEPLDFTRDEGTPLSGEFMPTLMVPDAFWFDVDPTECGPFTGPTNSQFTLDGFAGATAPMDRLLVTCSTANNPAWVQDSTGLFLAYDGVVPAGNKLVIDTSTWQLNQVPGSSAIPGSTAWAYDPRKVRYHPDIARWLQLAATAGGPRIRFTHTGGGSATWAVSGKRAYLLG